MPERAAPWDAEPAATWLHLLVPPDIVRQLQAVHAGFPGYDITVRAAAGRWLFDARRLHGGAGPYPVITADARTMWRKLRQASGE